MSAGDLQLMRVDAAVVVVSPSLAFSTDGVFYAPASAFRSRSKRSLKRRGNKVKRTREKARAGAKDGVNGGVYGSCCCSCRPRDAYTFSFPILPLHTALLQSRVDLLSAKTHQW